MLILKKVSNHITSVKEPCIVQPLTLFCHDLYGCTVLYISHSLQNTASNVPKDVIQANAIRALPLNQPLAPHKICIIAEQLFFTRILLHLYQHVVEIACHIINIARTAILATYKANR